MGSSMLKRTISSGAISALFTSLWLLFVLGEANYDYVISTWYILPISLIVGGLLILATCYIWGNTKAVSGLFIFLLGFVCLIIDLIQFHPLSASPTADFILMGGFMFAGLVTLFAGKASPIVGGFLVLVTWYIWNNAPVEQQYGEGDIFLRVFLPFLALLFILAGVLVAVAYRKK